MGFIDFDGNIVVKPKYNSISESENVIGIKDTNEAYFKKANNQYISKIKEHNILHYNQFKDGYCEVWLKDVKGNVIINKNFNTVLGLDDDLLYTNLGDGYFSMHLSKKD